jgi:hypothetical protein
MWRVIKSVLMEIRICASRGRTIYGVVLQRINPPLRLRDCGMRHGVRVVLANELPVLKKSVHCSGESSTLRVCDLDLIRWLIMIAALGLVFCLEYISLSLP